MCRAHFSQTDIKIDIISVASSPLQTNHAFVSKNTSFTVSYLVLKTKEVHSKTENGQKKNGFDTHDVDVHSMHQRASVTQRPSFSLLEPSDFIFTFCSSIFAGFIFALLLAYFLSTTSTATLIWSKRPQPTNRSDQHRRICS